MSLIKLYHKKIGEGRYANVFEGWIEREGIVAIKRITLEDIQNNEGEEVLKELDHPNVVKLLHIESDKDFKYYALEMCQASMNQLFKDDKKNLRGKMPPQRDVFLQMAKGLEYVHEKGLIHRDLKPENVLIWVDGTGKNVLMKWADFGSCIPVHLSISEKDIGTKNWNAPEILKTPPEKATVKSDVFSEGLVFGYYLLEGDHPYGSDFQQNYTANCTPDNLIEKMQHPTFNIIMEMLKDSPDERITSSDVVTKINSI